MADPNAANRPYEERRALYYPYIHIRSENWLKHTILAFQQVQRIVPDVYVLADDETIQPYRELQGRDGRPLLDQAPIFTDRLRQAHQSLFTELKEHERALIDRYSQEHTPEALRQGENAFQLHRLKVQDSEFLEWLEKNNLAWRPTEFKEGYAFQWLIMHPRLGGAVMSVLALGLADQEGLKVVTPSRRTHETLLANTQKQMLAKLLGIPMSVDDKVGDEVSTQELCQVVLMNGFDLTRVTAKDIRDMVLKGGRELRKFYGKLSELAGNIPSGLGEEERRRRLKAKAEEALEDWRACTEKLPQLKEAIKEGLPDKGLGKLLEAAKEAWLQHSMVHILGGLHGIALSILVKAGSTMVRKRDTSYEFLSRVEKVADRSIGSLYVPQWRELAS